MKTELPPFYNLYDPLEHTPLGFRGLYWDRPKRKIDQEDLLKEIERNPDNLNYFTVVLETTEGIFCRTIEEEASKIFNEKESRWELTWEPIHIGQPLTIHKEILIYKDQIAFDISYPNGGTEVDADGYLIIGVTINK